MNRRHFFAAAAAAGVTVTAAQGRALSGAPQGEKPRAVKGNLKQSVCRWCFGGMKLEDLATAAKGMGYQSIELLDPQDWPVVAKAGLTCAVGNMVRSNPIQKGFNRVENHDAIIKELEERLPLVKEAGIPNQICFSGNRAGLDDKEGLKNCAKGLKRITPLAEKLGVTIIMELLNSKRDHGDYQCDRTPWGVDLVNEVGSDRFKLLYDIYHMQIMEGDVIATIQKHHKAIGHYHTAGNPGRNEFDDTQELNYKGICSAIVATGFKGFLGQEFMPKRDGMTSLREAFEICDV
jgi:hydroxypyruvate isomerase